MNLGYIIDHWKNPNDLIKESYKRAWDSVACDYAYDENLDLEKKAFLDFMQSKAKLNKDINVLDVGCGGGAYSIALASKVKNVVGVDFSPKMIELANDTKKRMNITNAEFIECDWHNCDGEKYKGKYDLVFAHTTPAIADYDTFLKMMEASRKYCFYSKHTGFTDEIYDDLCSMVGIEKKERIDTTPYIFTAIWEHGYKPEINYEEVVWNSKKPVDEAINWYLGILNTSKELTEKEEQQVIEYINKISEDGYIKSTKNTTIVSFFWEVNNG